MNQFEAAEEVRVAPILKFNLIMPERLGEAKGLLMAIPMGFLFAIYPEIADGVTEGVKQWLHAIPEEIITLFGVGYLGYTGARSLDKRKRQ